MTDEGDRELNRMKIMKGMFGENGVRAVRVTFKGGC
jgi:hypothetical protein